MAKELINATFESDLAPIIVGSTILGTTIIAGIIVVKYNKIDIDFKNKQIHLDKAA